MKNYIILFAISFAFYFSCSDERSPSHFNENLRSIIKDDSLTNPLESVEIESFSQKNKNDFYDAFLKTLEVGWKTIPEYVDSFPDLLSNTAIQRCGAFDNNPADTQRDYDYSKNRLARFYFNNFTLKIPIKFHMLYPSYEEKEDHRSKSYINNIVSKQIDLLNEAFNNHDISFTLDTQDIHIYKDDHYYSANYNTDSIFDNTLKKYTISTKNYLNIISTGSTTLLGRATFPMSRTSSNRIDGVIFREETIPGYINYGKSERWEYSYGKTLIHEVGHYLGLYHIFHMNEDYCRDVLGLKQCDTCNILTGKYNGCDSLLKDTKYKNIKGDLVDDTHPQKYCHFNYCIQENSFKIDCNNLSSHQCNSCEDGLLDELDNYMGYTDDLCMSRFSEGQIIRIKQQTSKHRPAFIVKKFNSSSFYDKLSKEIQDESNMLF